MKQLFIGIVLLAILGVAGYFLSPNKKSGATQEQPNQNQEPMADQFQIEDITIGEGKEAVAGSLITAHYTGTFKDGTKFDSSLDRGTPFEFMLGRGQVIKGWDEGFAGMKEGGKRKLTIPYDLAYGAQGRPGIPPFSTLIFEVELISVQAAE